MNKKQHDAELIDRLIREKQELEANLQNIIEQINKYPMKMPEDPSVIDEKTLPPFISTLKHWGREGWAAFSMMKCRVTDLEAYLDALERGFTEPWRDDFKLWKEDHE